MTTNEKQTIAFESLFKSVFIALIIVAPLPLGSNRIIAWSSIATLMGVVVALFGCSIWYKKALLPVSIKYFYLIIFPFIAVLLFALSLNFPIWPASLHHSLWADVTQALSVESITLLPILDDYLNMMGIIRFLLYGLVFWLALQWGRSSRFSKRLWHVLMWTGVTYALYGIFIDLNGSDKVLWFDKTAYVGSVTSTFLNRNSYATYAGIGLIVTTALLLHAIAHETQELKGRQLYLKLISNLIGKGLVYLCVMMVLLCALLLTHSRAGIASVAIGIVTLVCFSCAMFNLSVLRKAMIGFGAALICVFAFFMSVGDENVDRYERLAKDSSVRGELYAITWRAIEQSPLVGVGLDNFEGEFRLHRGASTPYTIYQRVDHAHNTYLEAWLELGTPAFLLLLVSFITAFITCIKGVISRKRYGYFAATTVAITVQIAIHSLFDFSLEMPAIAISYAAILGVGVAQSISSKTVLAHYPNTRGYVTTLMLMIVAGGALTFFGFRYAQHAFMQLGADSLLSEQRSAERIITFDELQKIAQDRHLAFESTGFGNYASDASYVYLISAARKGYFSQEGSEFLEKSYSSLVQSLEASPANPRGWLQLAYITMLLSQSPEQTNDYFKMSVKTGAHEPLLVYYRLQLAMTLWPYFDEESKALVIDQIKTAWQWDQRRTLEFLKSDFARQLIKEHVTNWPDTSTSAP